MATRSFVVLSITRPGQAPALLLLLLRLLRPLFAGMFDWPRCSFLELLAAVAVQRGPHADVHGQALPRMTFIYAANGGDIAIIASVGDANMPQAHRRAQGWIEAEPACAGQ